MVDIPKAWKAFTVDYEAIADYDDSEKCVICLTPRQAIAVVGHMQAMYWHTRWENLPVGLDLFAWVSDIERELLMCACGDSASMRQLVECVCNLTNLVNIQVTNDVTLPDIPPDNPAQNLPGLNPAPGIDQQRYESALCDAAKLTVESIFEAIYLGQVENCEGQDIDWTGIGGTAATALGAASLIFPASAAILVSAGLAAAASAIAAEIFDYQPFRDEACPPERVPVEYSRIYGCQLWQNLREGITYDNVQTAFACKNPAGIQWYKDNIEDDQAKADQADADTRSVLSSFARQAQLYQGLMQMAGELSESPYQALSICEDCANCDPSTEVQIRAWDDARITSIDPPPDTIISPAQYWWPSGTLVTVTLDDVYCLHEINVRLIRDATDTEPSTLTVKAGGIEKQGTGGAIGSSTVNIGMDNVAAKVFTIQSNPAGDAMKLGLDVRVENGIYVRSLESYNDCS